MAQDVEMSDGPRYPDPTGAASNPLPYPSHEEASGSAPRSPQPNSDTSVEPTPASTAQAGSSFTNLTDYYNLAPLALLNLESLARKNGEGRRWEDANQKGASAGPSSGPELTFINSTVAWNGGRTIPLPGIHYKPDINRMDNAIRRNQQPTISPAALEEDSSPPPTRGGTRGRGRARARGWRAALKGTEHADLFKPTRLSRAATGVRPRGRGRGRSKRPVDPGAEYKNHQSQAMAAFLDNDLEAAKEHAGAAIRANPEVWASYSLLHEILQKQGRETEAIQVLASGAPTKRDPELWVEIGTRLMAAAGNHKTQNQTDFALMCYQEAIKIDKAHFGARSARMNLYIEVGSRNRARKECGTLLSIQPDNLALLWKFAKLSDEDGYPDALRGAIDLYEKAFQIYSPQPSFGDPDEQWDHLNLYAEMCIKVGPPDRGLYQLKQLARWFLGRQGDRFWNDVVQDDREFDETPLRRIQVPQVQNGQASQDPALYGHGLPIDLRVKMGIFRLQMHGPVNHNEALRHFDHLRRIPDGEIGDLLDLFLEVANHLRMRGMLGAALDYYDRLKPHSESLNRDYWMNFAQCCRAQDRTADAEQAYRRLVAASPTEVQARVNLIKLYETTARSVQAIPLADELITLGRSDALRSQNLGTYITACMRIKKKAIKAANGGVSPKAGSDDDESDEESDPGMQMDYMDVGESDPAAEERARVRQAAQEARLNRERPPLRELAPRPVGGIPAGSGTATAMSPGDDSESEAEPPAEADEDDDEAEEMNDEEPDVGYQSAPAPQITVQELLSQEPTFQRGGYYKKSLKSQRARVSARYNRLDELWSLLEQEIDHEAQQEWMQHAAMMAKDFRLMKEFYPSRWRDKKFTGLRTGDDRAARELANEMEATKQRLLEKAGVSGGKDAASSTQNITFHDIAFGEWHRIFSNLALLYAENSQQEECYELLNNIVLPANVFNDDSELKNASFAVSLCCASIFNDTQFVTEVTKRMQDSYSLAVVAHLNSALGRSVPAGAELNAKKRQNWLTRSVEEHDYLAMTPADRAKYSWGKRTDALKQKAKDGIHNIDAGLLVSYANSLSISGQNNHGLALPYLFRALALAESNPVVNLSIATEYVMRAANKTAAARQYDVALATSFLCRYYDLRVADEKARHRQEAEFNLARMWHLLNMQHLAVPGYEKVLKLSEEVQKEDEADGEDFGQEAAFALQAMYRAAGNEEAARVVTEEWLVI